MSLGDFGHVLFEGYEFPADDDVFGGTHEAVGADVAEELE